MHGKTRIPDCWVYPKIGDIQTAMCGKAVVPFLSTLFCTVLPGRLGVDPTVTLVANSIFLSGRDLRRSRAGRADPRLPHRRTSCRGSFPCPSTPNSTTPSRTKPAAWPAPLSPPATSVSASPTKSVASTAVTSSPSCSSPVASRLPRPHGLLWSPSSKTSRASRTMARIRSKNSHISPIMSATGSLALASRDANVDAPRRRLGVFLLAHEIDLGGADIGVPGELPHLVHRGPVPDGVVDRRLAQRMNADATTSQPPRLDPGRFAVLLHEPPGRLSVQVPPLHTTSIRFHGPKQGPLLVFANASSRHVSQDRPGCIKHDLPPLLVPLLGHVQVVLDAIGLQVSHAGRNHR